MTVDQILKLLEDKVLELSDPDDEGFAEGFVAGISYAKMLIHYHANNSEHIEG